MVALRLHSLFQDFAKNTSHAIALLAGPCCTFPPSRHATWAHRRGPLALTGILVYSATRIREYRNCIDTYYEQRNLAVYFLGSSFFSSGLGVGNLKLSGLRSTPVPTISHALDPPSKFLNACVISKGSVTILFFSSSYRSSV